MSTRNTILKQLKTDLEKIKTSRDYNTDIVEVRRGRHLWEDFTMKPSIGFWCWKDSKLENSWRQLYIYIYMYADSDGIDNVDDIYNLSEDVEAFLDSTDNTYTDNTWVDDTYIIDGGVQNPASMADLEIRIEYDSGRE